MVPGHAMAIDVVITFMIFGRKVAFRKLAKIAQKNDTEMIQQVI